MEKKNYVKSQNILYKKNLVYCYIIVKLKQTSSKEIIEIIRYTKYTYLKKENKYFSNVISVSENHTHITLLLLLYTIKFSFVIGEYIFYIQISFGEFN